MGKHQTAVVVNQNAVFYLSADVSYKRASGEIIVNEILDCLHLSLKTRNHLKTTVRTVILMRIKLFPYIIYVDILVKLV